jgi:hypothetical protein
MKAKNMYGREQVLILLPDALLSCDIGGGEARIVLREVVPGLLVWNGFTIKIPQTQRRGKRVLCSA